MAQVLVSPSLRLEQADPSKKGELKIIKSTKLLDSDEGNPYKLGCYKDTREALRNMLAYINGETLMIRYDLNEKTHILHFEVSTGKLLRKETKEKTEGANLLKINFDPVKGLFNRLCLVSDGEITKMDIMKFTVAGFGKNPNAVKVT